MEIMTHLEPQPVSSSAYQAITDVNNGFEKLIHDLQALQQFNFFPADILGSWLNLVLRTQAEANSHLLEVLHSREMKNSAYYDRLCWQWERELEDPNDVLVEAEERKRQIAAEQEKKESEQGESEQ